MQYEVIESILAELDKKASEIEDKLLHLDEGNIIAETIREK